MKNIDLSSFVGKNVNDLLKKGDQLFNDNLEGKIHAHKIYTELLEQVPNIYASSNEHVFRGMLRQKIWNCEKYFFWNEKYTSQAGQDKMIKKNFFDGKKSFHSPCSVILSPIKTISTVGENFSKISILYSLFLSFRSSFASCLIAKSCL